MKGYTSNIPENCACARLESVNASYKDLSEVCGRIRSKKSDWALSFLEQVSKGEIPVLYRRHNKRLGHRRELGGRKGRYPKKVASIILKVLRSAIANGAVKGLGDDYKILAACANKKEIYPRMAPKGRSARSFLETSRIEIVLQGPEAPKGVTVTPPSKKEEKKEAAPAKKETPAKKEEKPAAKKEEKPPVKKEEKPAAKEEKKEPPKETLKEEGQDHSQHKHATDKPEKKKGMPHQHGEHDKR